MSMYDAQRGMRSFSPGTMAKAHPYIETGGQIALARRHVSITTIDDLAAFDDCPPRQLSRGGATVLRYEIPV